MVEVVKAFMTEQEASAVEACANSRPAFKTYSADGTPVQVTVRYQNGQGDSRIIRRGKAGNEFFVERSYSLVFDHSGAPRVFCRFREPLSLVHGKGSWSLFACQVKFNRTLRQLGHRGIAISHYVWDRGCFSSLERLTRKHHSLLAMHSTSPTAALEQLTDWVIANGDCLHDAHGGFTWSLKPWMADEAIVKNMFIVVASYRNGYDLLMRHLPEWIRDHLRFEEPAMPPEAYEQLWASLDVQPGIAQKLVELRVLFRDGYLWVAEECKGHKNIGDDLIWALMGVWRFVPFSESRWVSVGPSTRAVVSSHLLGLSSLVAQVRKDPRSSDFYIGGAARMNEQLMSICIIAAMSASTSESLLTTLLEDDRVMLHIEALKNTIVEEISYISNLPEWCWAQLARLCDREVCELRSDAISASTASACFFSWRVLSETEELPWCLTVGDISKNIRDLSERPAPEEPVAANVRQLYMSGFPLAQLEEGLRLVRGAPWSSRGVEQAHAGASQTMKHRPELGEQSMVERAFMLTMRPMVLPSEEVREHAKLMKRVDKLKGEAPSHLRGRQLFCKEAMDAVAQLGVGTKQEQAQARRAVFRRHAVEYGRLCNEQRTFYEAKARQLAEDRVQEIGEEFSLLKEQEALLEMRAESRAQQRNPFCLDACRFSQTDMNRMQAMTSDARFSVNQVMQLRRQSMAAPEPPGPEVKLEMFAIPAYSRQVLPAAPWMTEVAYQRRHFHKCCIGISGVFGDRFYVFSFALQRNPTVLGLTRLVERARIIRQPADWNDIGDAFAESWRYDFDLKVLECHFTTKHFAGVSESSVFVLTGLVFLPTCRVVCDSDKVPLRTYLDSLPKLTKSITARATAAPARQFGGAESHAAIVQQNPWLLHHLGELKQWAKKHGLNKDGTIESPDDDSGDVWADEVVEATNDIFQRLADLRSQLQSSEEAEAYFRVAPFGGMSCLRLKGVGIVAYRARAVGRVIEEWCKRYSLQVAATFDISLYSDEGAVTMGREWSSRMAYWYQLFLDGGAPETFEYTEEMLDGYKESGAFRELAEALTAPQAVKRVVQLRAMRPIGR